MGAAKPQALELVPTSDRRTPTARDAARRNYQRLLERVLTRNFIGSKVDGMRSAMDLEHSFGPAYVRGRLLRGTAADAVIGVGEAESAAMVDGILTLGILWLDHCRQKGDGRRHFGGLKVIVPAGAWRTTAERMAWLNHAAADFQLFTLDERSEELTAVDFRDTGNLTSRLVHAFSRCRGRRALPGADRSSACAGSSRRRASASRCAPLRHRGWAAAAWPGVCARAPRRCGALICARRRSHLRRRRQRDAADRRRMKRCAATCLRGSSPAATPTARTPIRSSACSRSAGLRLGCAPSIAELLPGLRGDLLYTQVPALSVGDRGMLDLLTLDRQRPAGGHRTQGRRRLASAAAGARLLDSRARTQRRSPARRGQCGRKAVLCIRAAGILCRRRGFARSLRACCWPLRRCAFIPPTSRCCAIFLRKSSGS